jgi:ABC-type branched-subunit amino acid transport system substrate-binding protein
MGSWARSAFVIASFICGNAWANAVITIGQVAPLDTSDPVGRDIATGAKIWFDAVNAAGGVNGADLKLVSRSRGLDPKEAVTATRALIADLQPLSLLGLMGTGPMRALIKEGVLEEAEIPVVGIRSGAPGLHTPVNPYLFHTRANYAQEIERIIQLSSRMGMSRIAILYENSAFGKEGLAQAETALARSAVKDGDVPEQALSQADTAAGRSGMTLVAKATYELNSSDVAAAFKTIVDAFPQTVVLISTTDAAADFYRRWRARGYVGQVVALSVVDAGSVVKVLGQETAHGLGIAAVVPDPKRRVLPLCRDFLRDLRKYAPVGVEPTPAMLEGYISAKVLVEGIRRAGPNPTRKRLRAALESMKDYDLGGFTIRYSPAYHSGSTFVDVGILDRKGSILF